MKRDYLHGGAMAAFGLMLIMALLLGCAGYSAFLDQIPMAEFESFSYHRGGNVSSATVTATGASIKDRAITIDTLHITADYGPFVNFDVQLKGYRRQLPDDVTLPETKKEPDAINVRIIP